MCPGSSPLMRGKRGVLLRALSGPGLIPAHAGKTVRLQCKTCARPAHPRSHGENNIAPLPNLGAMGSSPLTRGKRDFARDELGCVGLIPAHTGKTHPRNPSYPA